LLGLAFAGLTCTAHAESVDPVKLAEQTAETYWKNVPCDGQIGIQWQSSTPTPALAGTEVEAWVTFETPLGQTDFLAGASTYTDCEVNISSNAWPTHASTIEAYPEFCQMMIHEFGHFQGYADSLSYPPSDIRYPLLTQANLPAVCMHEISSGGDLNSSAPPSLSRVLSTGAIAGSPRARRTRCFEVHCGPVARRAKTTGAEKPLKIGQSDR
jgi:hypothetical protein